MRSKASPQGHELTYWNAFATMNAFRSFKDGQPQRFDLTDIATYCDMAGIRDPFLRMNMAKVLKALDDEWFKLIQPSR